MNKQYDITFYAKGELVQFLDWTDTDSMLAYRSYGLITTFEGERYDKWKEDSLNKIFLSGIGSSDLSFDAFRTALNDSIQQCGLDKLSIERVVVFANVNGKYDIILDDSGKAKQHLKENEKEEPDIE